MKELKDLEPEVLPDGGENIVMITYSSTPDLSLYKSLYHPQHP
jgi:hypothetical protein